jgi:hypothetical protein
MPVLFSFTDLADIEYRDLHTLLLNTCVFDKNDRREGDAFLMGTHKITFMQLSHNCMIFWK